MTESFRPGATESLLKSKTEPFLPPTMDPCRRAAMDCETVSTTPMFLVVFLVSYLGAHTLAIAGTAFSNSLLLFTGHILDMSRSGFAVDSHVLCGYLNELDVSTNGRNTEGFLKVLLEQSRVPLVLSHANLDGQSVDRHRVRRLKSAPKKHAGTVLQVHHD